MSRVSGNWRSMSDRRVDELYELAQNTLNSLYSSLMTRAQKSEVHDKDGNITWSAVPWVTSAQDIAVRQMYAFTESLRNTDYKTPSWATRAMQLPGGKSVFDSSVDTASWVHDYIVRRCNEMYNTDVKAFEKLYATQNPAAMGGGISVTVFLASQVSMRLEYRLGSYAKFFAREWLNSSVVQPLIRKIRDWAISQVGRTYDSYDDFAHKADLYWDTLLQEMVNRTGDILKHGDVANPVVPLPDGMTVGSAISSFRNIAASVKVARDRQLKRGDKTYLPKDAFELVDLGLDCQTVGFYLHDLDVANAYIPSVDRASFEETYRAVQAYQDLMCNTARFHVVYDPAFQITDSFLDDLHDVLDDTWDEFITGDWGPLYSGYPGGRDVFSEATKKGVLDLLNRKLENAKKAVSDAIDNLKDDPWNGPAALRGDNVYVPLNAFDSGSDLYRYWVRNLVGKELGNVYAWLDGQEKVEKAFSGFTLSAEHAKTLLHKYYDDFDAALGGVLTRSVLAEKWGEFKAFILSSVGTPYSTVAEFNTTVEEKKKAIISDGEKEIERLRETEATTMPVEFSVYKQKVDSGAIDSLTDYALAKDITALKLLSPHIPWRYTERKEFEDVYAAYSDALNKYLGGPLDIPLSQDIEEYVKGVMATLDERVSGYRDLMKQVFGSDIELSTQLESFEGALRSALVPTIGESKTYLEIYKERLKIRQPLEAGLQGYLDQIVPRCVAKFDEVINEVKQVVASNSSLSSDLEDRANRLLMVKTSYKPVRDKVMELLDLMKKATHNNVGASLFPFMPFTPLKSKGGFSVEEFNLRQIDDMIETWVKPRLERGVMIEPKIDGYRMALHVRGGEARIYLEGDITDLSEAYPELVMEASKLPDVILDGELVEEIDGHVAPRIETGMYTRAQLDHAVPVFLVFDVLFTQKKDIHRLPYSQRRKMLSTLFASHNPKHIRELPTWYVNTLDGVKQKIDQARAYSGSEGAMLKVADLPYQFAHDTPDWAKIKRMEDVYVTILGREKNDKGMYNYECGVAYLGDEGVSKDHLKYHKGRPYLVLGTTFGVGEKLSVGERVEVAVTKIIRHEDNTGFWYEWQDPKVKASVKRNPDTIAHVERIGRLLGASISHPYRKLMDLYDASMTTSSVDELEKYQNEAYALFNMLNFPRLRRIALMVLTTIEDRVTPMGTPGKTPGKNEPGEVAGNVASVSMDLVRILEKKFDGVVKSVDMLPSARRDTAYNLLGGVRQAYAAASDSKVMERLGELRDRIQKYVDSLGGMEDLSAMEIEQRLAKLDGRIYEALHNTKSKERIRIATEVKDELTDMQKKNLVTSVYSDLVASILTKIDTILQEKDGKYSGAEIQHRLNEIEQEINNASDNLTLGLDWGKQQLNDAYGKLVQLIEDMTSSQLAAFGHHSDLLLDSIRDLWGQYMPGRKMPNVLGGALPLANIYDLLEKAKRGPGYLDPFLYDKMLRTPGWKELDDRARRIELAVIGQIGRIQDGEDPQEVIDECVRKVDRELNAEYGKQFDSNHPKPLGAYAGERSVWIDSDNHSRVAGIPEAARREIDKGNSVLLVGKDGNWRVAAVRDSSGNLISGDPDKHRKTLVKRTLNSFTSEQMPTMVRDDFGEQGLSPLETGIRRALNGAVEVDGGNGYFGGYVGGKPFVVTAMHVVPPDGNVRIRTVDGRVYNGKLLWRSPGKSDWKDIQDKDIAIFTVDGDFDNMVPLPLGSDGGYGMVVSPYHGESDMVRRTGQLADGWDMYTETERTRSGFSGAPVVDSLGHVIGLWNAGDSRYSGVDSRGGAISARTLRRAYEAAGITGGDRLESGVVRFHRLITAALSPFAIAPSEIPVHGVLYDVRSEGRDDKLLVFDWTSKGDLPIAIYIGGPADEGKLLNYQGGKLRCEVGKDLNGEKSKISDVFMLPSRMRVSETSGGYYEFYLNFDRVVGLNGLWGISEAAGAEYGVPALMFRLEGLTPFWARKDVKHKGERLAMPKWQKPTVLDVKKFFGGE